MQTTVKKVSWLTATDGTIGIVTIDNGFDTKTYIKSVRGYSENADIIDVCENGASFPTQATEHLMGFDINKTVDELKGIKTSSKPKESIDDILGNSSTQKPTIPINLFDLDDGAIKDSKMFYEGKIIKCLVAPYHTQKDIENMLEYSKNTYVFPEESMGIDKVKQLISLLVAQKGDQEFKIITKNQNIIMDMVDSSVKILTEGGNIVDCPCKTLLANIHEIRYKILENPDHQISESDNQNSHKYINSIIDILNSKKGSGITTTEHDILKQKISKIAEDMVSYKLSDMLSELKIV